ncbi:sporulation integral membrane protein YtvI [Alteribacter populi]|uniref:sporulation integral membrane protein YtvI n=1 Tax=Alteribacter populi TaxID=2011011 RepID=UPI000BBB1409|nr:sporulation integral membrane protein YtvI [Alteribacter populi]
MLEQLIRAVIVIFFSLLFIAIGYTLVRFLYPFIIGFIIALILIPIVNQMEKRFNWSRSVAVLMTMFAMLLVSLTFTTLIAVEVANGLLYLSGVLPDHIKNFVYTMENWISVTFLPLYERVNDLVLTLNTNQQETVTQSLQTLTGEITHKAGEFIQVFFNGLAEILLSLPNTITIMLFSLLSTFFITKDWPLILHWYNQLVPKKADRYLVRLLNEWKKSLFGYFFAQGILVSMTAFIVLIGFIIIGIEHAITAALLLAIIDLLPYLGTGIIFIPWILYSFFTGEWLLSIGLSVLYAIVVLQRQIAEPKVLSKHIGVHPIPLLLTLFLSYQWFGFLGLLFGPMILIVIQSMIRAEIIQGLWQFVKIDKTSG